MGARRGFTLLEVVLAAALLAASLLVIVSLIPSGVLSLKKAENIQAATAYALEVLEWDRANFSSTAPPDSQVTLNGTVFHVHNDVYAVPTYSGLYDLAVTVSWDRQPQPVILATRVTQPAPSPSP